MFEKMSGFRQEPNFRDKGGTTGKGMQEEVVITFEGEIQFRWNEAVFKNDRFVGILYRCDVPIEDSPDLYEPPSLN